MSKLLVIREGDDLTVTLYGRKYTLIMPVEEIKATSKKSKAKKSTKSAKGTKKSK